MKKENNNGLRKLISVKEIKEMYPENNYKVIGEYIRKKPLKENEGFNVELSNGSILTVKNTGEYKRSRYKVKAYISVADDEYIAVLERSWKVPILTMIILIAITLAGYAMWKMGQGPDIDPSIKDYVSDLKRPENLDETQILVPGLTTLVMEADTDTLSNTTLFNPKDNPCYFRFTIVDDSDTELYRSRLVPPGKGISNAKLNKVIKEGTYDVTIKINTYDLNNYEAEFNGAEIDSKLKALK